MDELNERLVTMEKDKASLEFELKTMTGKYEQEARALKEANSASQHSHNHESTAQALSGKFL